MAESYDDEDVWTEEDESEEEEEGEKTVAAAVKKTLPIDDASIHSMMALSSDSSIVQLEIAELLNQASIDYASSSASIERFVNGLSKSLAAIPEQEVKGNEHASGFLMDLGISDPKEVSLSFRPPSDVTTIGSFSLRSMVHSKVESTKLRTIDVAVEIPADCLFKKAYLSYRYHARRALYLSVISKHLSDKSKFGDAFQSQELCAVIDDPTRPALLLFPSPTKTATKKSSGLQVPAGFCIRLIVVISHNAFVPSKLGPDRNCIRWFSSPPTPASKGKEAEGSAPELAPTPLYNTSLLQDMSSLKHHSLLQKIFSPDRSSPLIPSRVSESLVLVKSWAKRRDLMSSSVLNGHILAMLMAHLIQGGKISPLMTSLQMFRCLLTALSDPNGLSKGLSMAREDPGAPDSLATSPSAHPPSVAGFRKHGHCVVFLDPSGWLNLTAGMSASGLNQVVVAAKHALALLQSPLDPEEAFSAVFLTPASPASSFDYHWKIQLPISSAEARLQVIKAAKVKEQVKASTKKRKLSTLQQDEVDDDGGKEATGICSDQVIWRLQEHSLESLIKQALGDRASLVRVLPRRIATGQDPTLALTRGLPILEGAHLLAVARMEASLATRMVDVGPPADDKSGAVERFRSFWGNKSELRRFQDGKISEAIVWECPPHERHTIPDKILSYALTVHLDKIIKTDSIHPSSPASHNGQWGQHSISSSSGRLDIVLLQLPPGTSGAKKTALASRGGGSVVTLDPSYSISSQRAMDATLDTLTNQLRSTEGLALKVVGVQPVGAAARQTATFGPTPHPLATAAVGSGGLGRLSGIKIPRCMEPIEVLVQLESSGRWPDDPLAFIKTKAALGLQLGMSLQTAFGHSISATEDHVDVLMEGFAFRLLFHSSRDEAMLAKQEAGSSKQEEGSSLYDPQRHPIVSSWHHGLISAVASTHSAFAPTVRLAKRWVGSQLLSNHLCDEAVELLVAATFTSPSPTPTAPGSRLSGLLRFLDLLSTHPWSSKALVIDPEAHTTKEQRAEAQERYDTRRNPNPNPTPSEGPCMCLCTPKDFDSRHWTWFKPGRAALHQLVTCARRTSDSLRSLIESSPSSSVEGSVSRVNDDLHWVAACFSPPPGSFDLVVTLRDEALPQSSRSLPQSLLFPTLKKKSASKDEDPSSSRPRKSSRAFLRAFPDQVISSFSNKAGGSKELISELLIGFDPVKKLVLALEERFGHLGAFGADYTGGSRDIGIKWFPSSFQPSPLSAATAHTAMPSSFQGPGEGKGKGGKKGQMWVEANLPLILAEIKEIGEGLVEDIIALE